MVMMMISRVWINLIFTLLMPVFANADRRRAFFLLHGVILRIEFRNNARAFLLYKSEYDGRHTCCITTVVQCVLRS